MDLTRIKRKILLADDDEATRILIRGIFEGTNIELFEAESGEYALELFKKYTHILDLILLDIILPTHSGWELIKIFRDINPSIPAVALSAMSSKELAMKCRIAGFNTWLSKPFEIEEITKLIDMFLER
jgi:CheY-like chemotaxis protein